MKTETLETLVNFLERLEKKRWMQSGLRLTDPLHKPIGNDIYVKNPWLRLSSWRAFAVMLPIAFIVGWYIVPETLLFLFHLLVHAFK
jgi:hypothetical protein